MNSSIEFDDVQPPLDNSFWFADLAFRRPAMLSDDDMAYYFRRYDGKWSEQTKLALARHRAAGLDLNENWALTGRIWSCAGCGRSKDECFRLSKRNVLLGKLELHHDHMRDNIWPLAGEILGEEWREATPGATSVLDAIRDLVSRFSEVLICAECNAAEGNAKKAVSGIHSRFTYTAPEIGQFITAAPGKEHKLDLDRAGTVWRQQEEAFQTRLNLLHTLVKVMGEGRLAHSNEGRPGGIPLWMRLSDGEMISDAFRREIGRDDDRYRWLHSIRNEFLARSVSLDSRRLALSKVVRKKSVAPNDQEYAEYVDLVSRREWESAPETWTCACCDRAKREIVRKSGKGKWSGGIRSVRIILEETDEERIAFRRLLFPSFRNEFWIGAAYYVNICSDCSDVSRDARQHDRSAPDAYLSLNDIRECLTHVSPNVRHEVNYQEVIKKLRNNEKLDSAFQAYDVFESLVADFRATFDFQIAQGVSREAAVLQLRDRLLLKRNIEQEEEQAILVDWLLSIRVRANESE